MIVEKAIKYSQFFANFMSIFGFCGCTRLLGRELLKSSETKLAVTSDIAALSFALLLTFGSIESSEFSSTSLGFGLRSGSFSNNDFRSSRICMFSILSSFGLFSLS